METPPTADFVTDVQAGALRRLLALDCVQDPGNLVTCASSACDTAARNKSCPVCLLIKCSSVRAQGSLTRTAAALGWDGLFLLPGAILSLTVLRVRESKLATE